MLYFSNKMRVINTDKWRECEQIVSVSKEWFPANISTISRPASGLGYVISYHSFTEYIDVMKHGRSVSEKIYDNYYLLHIANAYYLYHESELKLRFRSVSQVDINVVNLHYSSAVDSFTKNLKKGMNDAERSLGKKKVLGIHGDFYIVVDNGAVYYKKEIAPRKQGTILNWFKS
jgi:hypothetical protein